MWKGSEIANKSVVGLGNKRLIGCTYMNTSMEAENNGLAYRQVFNILWGLEFSLNNRQLPFLWRSHFRYLAETIWKLFIARNLWGTRKNMIFKLKGFRFTKPGLRDSLKSAQFPSCNFPEYGNCVFSYGTRGASQSFIQNLKIYFERFF